jgi:hypothetical protein
LTTTLKYIHRLSLESVGGSMEFGATETISLGFLDSISMR